MAMRPSTSLLRPRGLHEGGRVTNIELFFDLVFVFAVTQLSHSLLHDLTATGAVHAALLFVAIWWVWISTSWVTNWLDPERTPVRLLLLVLMLAGLVLSTSIPEAFEAKGAAFAFALVFIEVTRSLFMLWALGNASPRNSANFRRILLWQVAHGVFWIAGAFMDGEARFGCWAIAVALTWAAPALGFYVPGLGRSTTADWDVDGSHLAERCSLFIIIALGESVLVTGASFGERDWTQTTLIAFAAAFIGSVAMWWIYFDTGAERGARAITGSADPGRLARLGYTYLHLVIVAGIIVAAVADDLILADPSGAITPSVAAVLVGGPMLYIVGNAFFKYAAAGRLPLSHLVGIGLLASVAVVAPYTTPLGLGLATTVILVAVAAWEALSLGRKPRPPR